MEKNIAMEFGMGSDVTGMKGMVQSVGQLLMPLTRYYAQVLGRELGLRQTLLLIHAQVTFFFAVFPAETSVALRAALGLWFWWAVKRCKKAIG